LTKYDYIICGTGCAGLSLVVHLIQSGQFSRKKILLVDQSKKETNDRTWCFWEQEAGLFESILTKKWDKVWFYGNNTGTLLDLAPYSYKMIRGIDFYEYALLQVSGQANIELRYGTIESIHSDEAATYIVLNGAQIHTRYIFNSILWEQPAARKHEFYLLQHFKGWVVETPEPFFNEAEATLMDFRVSQQHGTTFVYVMPVSATRALVEYTLFSEKLLTTEDYAIALKDYMDNWLQLKEYTIAEEEFGVIPMTNISFPRRKGNIIYIGTAGGQTKASSGYTFRYIQAYAKAITESLLDKGHPFVSNSWWKKRFDLYDSTLLHVLANRQMGGKEIFAKMFDKNKASTVLQFLDNQSGFGQELQIMNSVPKKIFIPAALKELLRRIL
jgi:lycopene beta-cyclase